MKLATLFDGAGRQVVLGKEIGKGGEGAVYDIPGTEFVAKVANKPLDPKEQAKRHAMVTMSNPEFSNIAAWPTATLHNGVRGPIVGIVMPKIQGFKEVHTLYSPAQRTFQFLEADWRFLVFNAINTARVFDVFHCHGIVIGDVNQ